MVLFSFHTLNAVGNICRKPMKAEAAAGKGPVGMDSSNNKIYFLRRVCYDYSAQYGRT